jgi:hypothetical protein
MKPLHPWRRRIDNSSQLSSLNHQLSYDMATLRKALDHLKKQDVHLEDPGDEIGPEAPGSPHRGLWFHDLDGYRWELSVQGGK